MRRLRSVFSLFLVLFAVVIVGCSSPQASVPTTYTPQQIEQLQTIAKPFETYREQLTNLQTLIAARNWTDLSTTLHGPLGQLRKDAIGLSRSLLPKDREKAEELARKVFGHLERLDGAAKERLSEQVEIQYREALEDFDAFLSLIPKAS